MGKNKTLEAVISIAGQLDPSLQKAIADTQKQFSGMQIGITAITTAAVAATAAMVGFGTKAVNVASQFETDFAKTATLLSGTTEELGEYQQAIIGLSNETGAATSELTETVYQAISAGVDQAEAVEFAGQAVKLAEGGFTDAATAVDVMTTALNAYGDQSGLTAESVSDLLITTQNLGKTSVNELAASVGKVIPIASAYGVEMDNLSAAYAQLTAGGIATAEAGTYLKSMLNELGDSGSTVSKTLKQMTGMSFAELTEDGMSLGDVLAILGIAVENDSGKFNELWSSSEAGVGALSLLNAGAEAYDATLEQMRNSTGATDAAYETMTNTLEHQKTVLKNLGQNFMTTVGLEMLPYVEDLAGKAIPKISDWMDENGPKIIEFMKTVIEKGEDIYHWANDNAIPVIVDIGTFGKETLGEIIDFGKDAYDTAKSIYEYLSEHKNILVATGIVIGGIATAIGVYTLASNTATIATGAMNLAIGAYTTVTGIATAAGSAFGAVLAFITSPITLVILGITALVAAGYLLVKNWDTVKEVALSLWDIMKAFAVGIKDTVVTTFNGIAGYIAQPINSVIGIINGAIEAVDALKLDIPDWVPVLGGKSFALNIPTIDMLAKGGFTNGVSIAGEAGQEAVISFDSAYRDENLSYWAEAGRRLGVDDSYLDAMANSSGYGSGGSELNITFAPQITVNGESDSSLEKLMVALRDQEEEFLDMLEEMLRGRNGGDKYVFG